jgi:alkylation response protein AidB-like acyl-CoA dehydrogenase
LEATSNAWLHALPAIDRGWISSARKIESASFEMYLGATLQTCSAKLSADSPPFDEWNIPRSDDLFAVISLGGVTVARDRAARLTPVARAFSTDVAVEVASLGIQVYGGMGFIEETGAAQHLSDARIRLASARSGYGAGGAAAMPRHTTRPFSIASACRRAGGPRF